MCPKMWNGKDMENGIWYGTVGKMFEDNWMGGQHGCILLTPYKLGDLCRCPAEDNIICHLKITEVDFT